MELQTGHIGKGCDRDSYSDRSVRRLCGEFLFSAHFVYGVITRPSRLALRIA